jgi:hypothetical protein
VRVVVAPRAPRALAQMRQGANERGALGGRVVPNPSRRIVGGRGVRVRSVVVDALLKVGEAIGQSNVLPVKRTLKGKRG